MAEEKKEIKMKKVHSGIKRKRETRDVGNRIWFALTIILTVIYLIWRCWKTIPFGYGIVSMVVGIGLLIIEILGFFELLIHIWNMFSYETVEVPEVPENMYPDVDVFIATYNEPVELLYKTVNGCKYMDYPDKKKVHIYVLDDGSRPEMEAMCRKAGVGYIKREEHDHAKAGNLNNALAHTTSPYIVTFDADMIPRHEFLMRTIPFFVDREMQNAELDEEDQIHIGFVQTPQAFYNPDLFQYNLYSESRIPNEQDYFYRDIQVARNRSNSVIYGGSNTVISRLALEVVGGFFDKSITEDYGTGISIQKAGFLCIATNEVLASGLSPDDLQSLIQQRIRWGRGVITTNRKQHIFLSPHLSFGQKMNYWASEFYWYSCIKRLFYYIAPLIFAVFGYMVVKCTLPEVLIFWLPMYVVSNISMRIMSRNIRTTKWTGIYETLLFPYMLVPIIMETCFISLKTFKVTDKNKNESRAGKDAIYLTPFVLLIILSIIGIIRCIAMMLQGSTAGPIVVLFWIVFNMYLLIMSCFFVISRDFLRKHERVAVEMDYTMDTEGIIYTGKTRDISEEGIAVWMDEPDFIGNEVPVYFNLETDRYKARLEGRIAHVEKREGKWLYAFKVVDYCGTYDEYLQIVHDRLPALPQDLKKGGSVFEDLSINISRRIARTVYQNRKAPRVIVDEAIPSKDGKVFYIKDFNYQYCTLKISGEAPDDIVLLADDVELECTKVGQTHGDLTLYKIANYDKLLKNDDLHKKLEAWVVENWKKEQNEENAAETPAETAEVPAEKVSGESAEK